MMFCRATVPNCPKKSKPKNHKKPFVYGALMKLSRCPACPTKNINIFAAAERFIASSNRGGKSGQHRVPCLLTARCGNVQTVPQKITTSPRRVGMGKG